MEGLDITMVEVEVSAREIHKANRELTDLLGEACKQIDDLQLGWQSEAGAVLRERFTRLGRSFAAYEMIVEGYAKFLDNAVTNYESVEAQITGAASLFSD